MMRLLNQCNQTISLIVIKRLNIIKINTNELSICEKEFYEENVFFFMNMSMMFVFYLFSLVWFVSVVLSVISVLFSFIFFILFYEIIVLSIHPFVFLSSFVVVVVFFFEEQFWSSSADHRLNQSESISIEGIMRHFIIRFFFRI